VAEKNKDPQNLGLFKETLAVLFGLNQKTIDRVMAIVSNSEDKLNVKTYIVRDKSGPRAVEWLRKAIAYARTEGSQKHEDDVFDLSKDQDLESTARIRKAEQHEFDHPQQDEVIDMEKPIKECTFRDYLMELQVRDMPNSGLLILYKKNGKFNNLKMTQIKAKSCGLFRQKNKLRCAEKDWQIKKRMQNSKWALNAPWQEWHNESRRVTI